MKRLGIKDTQEKSDLFVNLFRIALIILALYFFLISVGLMGSGFKVFGKGFAKALIETTSNPFVGLFVGILATALIQSSSTTTSMVVAFVAAGSISVPNAIPIVMGANVGTAVTSTFVSLGHVARIREFQRAFAAGTVHDMFNILAVVIILPLEIMTGFLEKSARKLAELLAGSGGVEFKSPLNLVTKPLNSAIVDLITRLEFSKLVTGIIVVVLGIILLIVSLYFLSKLLKILVLNKLQTFFQSSLYNNGLIAILLGMVFTAIVQSSSVTTSLMIPMAAAGIMTLQQVFPVALGANIGTTVTALLASLATGSPAGLTIALVHLLFNLSGIAIFYPLPITRQIPIKLAVLMSELAVKNRMYGIVMILVVYFLLPGLAIYLT
jgi:solute carrier family 34 (sodium-dependent phosphate cotransporter)